jgi:hypothetical protein
MNETEKLESIAFPLCRVGRGRVCVSIIIDKMKKQATDVRWTTPGVDWLGDA